MGKVLPTQTCPWVPDGIRRMKLKLVFWTINTFHCQSTSSPQNAISMQKQRTPSACSNGLRNLKINAESWEEDIWILWGESHEQCLLQSNSGACKCKYVCESQKATDCRSNTSVGWDTASAISACFLFFVLKGRERKWEFVMPREFSTLNLVTIRIDFWLGRLKERKKSITQLINLFFYLKSAAVIAIKCGKCPLITASRGQWNL